MSKRVNLRAIKFDGDQAVQSGIVVPDADNLSFTEGTRFVAGNDKPFSISFWMNIDKDENNSGGYVAGKINFDGMPDGSGIEKRSTEWFVRVDPNAGSYNIGIFLYDTRRTNSGHQLRIGQDDMSLIENNTWHNVTFTYSANPVFPDNLTFTDTGLKMYIDGSEVAPNRSERTGGVIDTDGDDIPDDPTKYTNMANTDAIFSIGMFGEGFDEGADANPNDPINESRVFKGKLADICIFNKELSTSEVAEVYNSGKVKDMSKFSAYDNIVSWWKMGDDKDNNDQDGIRDYVGSNHGTIKFLDKTEIINDPSLLTDRVVSKKHVYTSFGKTRSSANVMGLQQAYIHGGESGSMPAVDPTETSDGFPASNQKFLHTYWKAEAGAGISHNLKAFGYVHATGRWSLLKDIYGNPVELTTNGDSVDTYRLFEISGIDKIYFKQSGDPLAASDLFSAAVSHV